MSWWCRQVFLPGFLLFLLLHLLLIHAQEHELVCLLHALVLDAAYGNNKAQEEHSRDNGKDKGKVWKISCDPEVVTSHNRRRPNPAEVIEVPESSAAQGRQLENSIQWITQVELVYPKDAEEEREHKRCQLRLPRRCALWAGPVAIAIAECQSRSPRIRARHDVVPVLAPAMTVAL